MPALSLPLSRSGAPPWHSPSFDRPAGAARLARTLGVIATGGGLYGLTVGSWRGPELGIYVALKLPLVLILTVACNGLLNGILAQRLGSGLGFRQTSQAILDCYQVMAVILGSLAPVSGGLAWILATTTPPNLPRAHALLICFHTAVIAFAGLIAHLRMLRGLHDATGHPSAATRTFLAWTAGNLFVGAQIGYALRPWAASPGLPIAFLRHHPLEGNFYLAFGSSAQRLVGGNAWLTGAALAVAALLLALGLRRAIRHEMRLPSTTPVPSPPQTTNP